MESKLLMRVRPFLQILIRPKVIVCLVLLTLFLGWFFFAPNSGYRYLEIHREIKSLTTQVDEIKKENADLRKEIDRLKNDKAYLAEVARRKYGFLRKNEEVFDFKKSSK